MTCACVEGRERRTQKDNASFEAPFVPQGKQGKETLKVRSFAETT